MNDRVIKEGKDGWAIFSPCGLYRYALSRKGWHEVNNPDDWKIVAFIGLNPSTADENINDPTITRCINFARRWGYDELVMLNLFAFRATDPKEMKACAEPIGVNNNDIIKQWTGVARFVVAAWGNHGTHLDRDVEVTNLIGYLSCLGINGNGTPKHPLYLAADSVLIPYQSRKKFTPKRQYQ